MGIRVRAAAGLVATGLVLLLPASALATSNLSVNQTLDEPDPVVQGSNVTYTLEVKNTGPDAAANVTVRAYVPAGTAPVSFTQTSGPAFALAFTGPEFTATAASFASGATAVFKAVYTANTSGTISHKTQVTTTSPDPALSNNEDIEGTTVLARGLSLSISDVEDPVQVGSNIEYELTVRNRGASAASGVTLADVLPPETTFVSFAAPAGWVATTPVVGNTGQVTATNPSLGAGAVATLTVVAKAHADGVVENTGEVSGTVPDDDPLDNSDTELTSVAAPPEPPPDPPLPDPPLPTLPLSISPAPTPAPVTCNGEQATIVGTAGADNLKGTPGDDVIAALAGADKVSGGDGDDLICGGSGKDSLKGGAGNDKLVGGPNRDTCIGGAGKDSGSCEKRTSF